MITFESMFKIYPLWREKNNKSNLFIRDVELHKPIIKGLWSQEIKYPLTEEAEVKFKMARDFRITNANEIILLKYRG